MRGGIGRTAGFAVVVIAILALLVFMFVNTFGGNGGEAEETAMAGTVQAPERDLPS